jgi:hypothetical protein
MRHRINDAICIIQQPRLEGAGRLALRRRSDKTQVAGVAANFVGSAFSQQLAFPQDENTGAMLGFVQISSG